MTTAWTRITTTVRDRLRGRVRVLGWHHTGQTQFGRPRGSQARHRAPQASVWERIVGVWGVVCSVVACVVLLLTALIALVPLP